MTRRIGDMVVDALADLHQVDPHRSASTRSAARRHGRAPARGLDPPLARRPRQALPGNGPLLAWLQANLPATRNTVLLHNDFKLDNMIVAADDPPARRRARLGHGHARRPAARPRLSPELVGRARRRPRLDRSRRHAHLAPRLSVARTSHRRYAARTGFDVSDINWYYVYNAFRLAVIIQQIYIRYVRARPPTPTSPISAPASRPWSAKLSFWQEDNISQPTFSKTVGWLQPTKTTPQKASKALLF